MQLGYILWIKVYTHRHAYRHWSDMYFDVKKLLHTNKQRKLVGIDDETQNSAPNFQGESWKSV